MRWWRRELGCVALFAAHLAGCGTTPPVPRSTFSEGTPAPAPPDLGANPRPSSNGPLDGMEAGVLRLHVYDVGQGLSVLLDLPDGRHVLVDTGDAPARRGCGPTCDARHRALMAKLARDLRGRPLDLLWLTHPHSDHLGGAVDVLGTFRVGALVDNGRDASKPEVRQAHDAARRRGVPVFMVGPEHPSLTVAFPQDDDRGGATLTAIVPTAWPRACVDEGNVNDCSLALRVDFRGSSALFTGDAEKEEETELEPGGPATLLQVGHHGSHTSSSAAFLARVRPRYAVLSAGARGEGANREYCHPRADAVRRLTHVLGGPRRGRLEAFDGRGHRCDRDGDLDEAWTAEETSDRLWATERDGDVVLRTTGDGVFTREPPPHDEGPR